MCSAFVVLAYLDVVEQTTGKLSEEEHLKMNILELWGCLIFQTLSECELGKYMDPTTMVRRRHLNVANPLWQTFTTAEDELVGASNSERFKVLLQEADELTCEYYRSLQAEFFSLKDSPDPTLKAYYYSRMERSLAALEGVRAKKLKQTLQGLMAGQSKEVCHEPIASPKICFGSFVFRISKRNYPEAASSKEVFAQAFLQETSSADCYSSAAQESDPAARLNLRITGEHMGQPYSYFVRAGGDRTAGEINALVDFLDGFTKDEILSRPRRRLPRAMRRNISGD